MKLMDLKSNLNINEREIFIHFLKRKIFGKILFSYEYCILIAHYLNENYYQLTDLFLETTPGRLIFSVKLRLKNKIMLITRTVTKKILETIVHETFSNFGSLSSSSLLDS
jgi:hypothetical protein